MTPARKLADAAEELTRHEIMEFLTAEGALQQCLFEVARQVRHASGEDDVVLRGVIEISNLCFKNCDYCAMRFDNEHLGRYSMPPEEIITVAEKIKAAGIGIVFLQAGQNLGIDEKLYDIIATIKDDLGLEVMLCLGERVEEVYESFARAGAGGYILKFETSDAALFRRITHTDLNSRLRCLERLRMAGMKIGTGNIVGLPGQSLESLLDDIFLSTRLASDFVSTSPFIPNSNTPFEAFPKGSADLTLNTMALLRILMKKPLIPAVSALETVYPDGQSVGLNAGANVITINFTPKENQKLYRIYSDQRFVVRLDHALRSIDRAGLKLRSGPSC